MSLLHRHCESCLGLTDALVPLQRDLQLVEAQCEFPHRTTYPAEHLVLHLGFDLWEYHPQYQNVEPLHDYSSSHRTIVSATGDPRPESRGYTQWPVVLTQLSTVPHWMQSPRVTVLRAQAL